MLNTVGRFIYTKYWGIYYVEHWEDLFTQNTEEYFMLSTVRRFIYTKYRGILYAEHCGKIYSHKILRNTVCWALWEDLFTQNTGDYFLLNTVGIFIYINYWKYFMLNTGEIYLHKILEITLCWTLWEDLFKQNTVCWTLWEDLFTQNTEEKCMFEHCGKIYLNKILRNTVCWALWEDLFTQNTKEYCMLSTVGRFIYTKYWGILYVEYCEKI